MQKQETRHFNFAIFSKKAQEFLISLFDDLKLILTFLPTLFNKKVLLASV